MKVYKEVLNGCIWCPHHEELNSGDDTKAGYCQKLTHSETQYIARDEMMDEDHPENPYYKFPKWCHLEDN